MGLRKILILSPLIIAAISFQGCSKSSEQSQDSSSDAEKELRRKDQQIIEVKSLGPLINDVAGVLSLEKTGLIWNTHKDKVSLKEFYLEAYKKGCWQIGQPQDLLRIDPELRVGQKFKINFKDLGQAHELSTIKRRTISHIDHTRAELIYTSEFVQGKDSRISDYRGPLVTENPFEKIKLSLGVSRLTQKPVVEAQAIEMNLHPDLMKMWEGAASELKIECNLEQDQNTTHVFALGQIKMKSGQLVKANKKTTLSTGTVICRRVEYNPLSMKNELEKFRGQVFRIGPGKNIHMSITSNQLPSPAMGFCGGTRLLDLKLLVLDDGKVIQQRTESIDEVSF